jgi:hypothetical protein
MELSTEINSVVCKFCYATRKNIASDVHSVKYISILHAKQTNILYNVHCCFYRRECGKLREEITEQKDSEMRAALEQLSKMKDEEIMATRSGWENKVADLTKQVIMIILLSISYHVYCDSYVSIE